MSEVLSTETKFTPCAEIIPTYWCSVCNQTSVAERDLDGNIHCPRCEGGSSNEGE